MVCCRSSSLDTTPSTWCLHRGFQVLDRSVWWLVWLVMHITLRITINRLHEWAMFLTTLHLISE